jgi:hypothetical protein
MLCELTKTYAKLTEISGGRCEQPYSALVLLHNIQPKSFLELEEWKDHILSEKMLNFSSTLCVFHFITKT